MDSGLQQRAGCLDRWRQSREGSMAAIGHTVFGGMKEWDSCVARANEISGDMEVGLGGW